MRQSNQKKVLNERVRQRRNNNHFNPASCGDAREGGREALTVADAGDHQAAKYSNPSFTHICGLSQKGGLSSCATPSLYDRVPSCRPSKAKSMSRQNLQIPVQGAWLADVLRGYFAYHALPTNIRSFDAFRTQFGLSQVPRLVATGTRNDGSTGSKW